MHREGLSSAGEPAQWAAHWGPGAPPHARARVHAHGCLDVGPLPEMPLMAYIGAHGYQDRAAGCPPVALVLLRHL
jgi:hypothetical protein